MRSLLGFAKNFGLFLLGLSAAAVALYALVPHQRPALTPVLAERERCQVLIVGPSYVNVGIDLKAFDAESARIGLDLHACKYAQSALQGYELRHVLDLLFEKPWPKLEYVVVDTTLGPGMGLGFERDNWFKPRVVDWHTFRALTWAMDHPDHKAVTLRQRAELFWGHVEHLALNYLGVGRGIQPLSNVRVFGRGAVTDGFVGSGLKHIVHREKGHPGYARTLQKLIAQKARQRAHHEEISGAWPLELRALVRSHGYDKTIAFLISPVLTAKRDIKEAGTGPDPLVVLDFDDPARYPALYTEDVRGETSHLAGRGPTIYSELLAQAIKDLKAAR
jgi:hypothetical protein